MVAELQSQVEELTKDKAELKRSNDLMRTQLDLLEQQNRTLLMNQLSAQPSSQMNGRNFLPGGNLSLLSMPNHIGSHASNVVNSMASRIPMFNLSATGYRSGNIVQDGASNLSSASASFLGGGAGGDGYSSLGQISLLDRLRLQQQLQQHQQQQSGLIAPSTGSNDPTSSNDQDLLLNNIRNKNSNGNSFPG